MSTLTERGRKIGYRFATGTSAAAAALFLFGAVYEAKASDIHYQNAAGVVREIDESLPLSGRKIIFELNSIPAGLDPSDPFEEGLIRRRKNLETSLVNMEVQHVTPTQAFQEQSERAAGNLDGALYDNLLVVAGVTSLTAMGIPGIRSFRAFRRRRAKLGKV